VECAASASAVGAAVAARPRLGGLTGVALVARLAGVWSRVAGVGSGVAWVWSGVAGLVRGTAAAVGSDVRGLTEPDRPAGRRASR
jgi:hypothetical protein